MNRRGRKLALGKNRQHGFTDRAGCANDGYFEFPAHKSLITI
jgi:hypothetical protein